MFRETEKNPDRVEVAAHIQATLRRSPVRYQKGQTARNGITTGNRQRVKVTQAKTRSNTGFRASNAHCFYFYFKGKRPFRAERGFYVVL